MKITVISDTHGNHAELKIPQTDILIHCGDFTSMGAPREVISFLRWFSKQPAKYKLFIAGNHELTLDETHQEYHPKLKDYVLNYGDSSIIYLEDSEIVVDGVKFYGTPWTPEFYGWAFNAVTYDNLTSSHQSETSLIAKCNLIPRNTDVLICHGPPKGLLDKTDGGDFAGSQEMRDIIGQIAPKLYLCGHIHESRGIIKHGKTLCVNASTLDRSYKIARSPLVFHLDENKQVSIDKSNEKI